jgi:hypothetical protein
MPDVFERLQTLGFAVVMDYQRLKDPTGTTVYSLLQEQNAPTAEQASYYKTANSASGGTRPIMETIFEGVKVNYMKIDEDLLNDSLTSEDFKNSMIVFDDIEAISSRALRKDVLRLMDDVLTTRRHYNVSACVVFHEATCGQPTKKILNESHSISFFPRTLSGRSMKYLCDSYLGLEKDEIKRIKKLKTRAVTVVKGYPKVIVSDKEIFCLGCDNDSSDSDNSSSSSDQRYTRKKQNSKYKIK